jgi:hypothetical protein
MGITGEPLRPTMAAETPAKPPDPPNGGGRFKTLRGRVLEDMEPGVCVSRLCLRWWRLFESILPKALPNLPQLFRNRLMRLR